MSKKLDSLGDRMKRYEDQERRFLMPRMPAIIRVDGRAFHTLLKKAEKPFDISIIDVMNKTARALVEQIQNARFAYVQSDEISILLVDYDKFETQQWFSGNINKIVSISAAIATATFSQQFGKIGLFDSRVFTLHQSEVCNYFIWRQQDWERNSLNMLCQVHYSHKELQGKSCQDRHDMLHEKGVNWNDLPIYLKRGRVVTQSEINNKIPIFSKNREFIEDFLKIRE